MFGPESFGVMGKSAETAADTVYANNFPASEKNITEKIFLKFWNNSSGQRADPPRGLQNAERHR